MKLKDILTEPCEITYRAIIDAEGTKRDTLTGVCRYDGHDLISEDGDNYSLEDTIVKYERTKQGLTVWESM